MKSAFSLIELMVVIAVVAILVAVSVPVYNTYIFKAKMSEVTTLGQGMVTAAMAYQAQSGSFPTLAQLGYTTSGNDETAANPSAVSQYIISLTTVTTSFLNGGYCQGERMNFNIGTNLTDDTGTQYYLTYDVYYSAEGLQSICYYNFGGGNGSTEDQIAGCINYNATYNGQLGSDIIGNIGNVVVCPY